jgi:cardiolipin synthase
MSFTIPNVLSILRMALIPFFIIAVIDGNLPRALIVFIVAGVTDALDGFIARFFNQESLLGAYLDPMADKLLLTSAYVALAIPNSLNGATAPIPGWVTVLVIARDVLIVTMVLVLFLSLGIRRFPPTILGKATTVVQVVTVWLILSSGVWHNLDNVASYAIYLVALMTLVSGVGYVYRANRMVADARQRVPADDPNLPPSP